MSPYNTRLESVVEEQQAITLVEQLLLHCPPPTEKRYLILRLNYCPSSLMNIVNVLIAPIVLTTLVYVYVKFRSVNPSSFSKNQLLRLPGIPNDNSEQNMFNNIRQPLNISSSYVNIINRKIN